MVKTHKIKLYPTKAQERLFVKSCGVARFAFNWGLDAWQKKREAGEATSGYSLIKELTAIKREQYPWMLEVSKTCPQYAILNLQSAFTSFFRKNSKFPRFKKRGKKDSFLAVESKETFKQKDYRIHIPRVGKVKCAENLRLKGKVNHVIVKRTADIWFACINVEIDSPPIVCENQTTIGVDMGIKTMLVLSDGTEIKNHHSLKSNLKGLKRLQQRLSRKVKGSANRKKAQIKVARKHYKISCLRSNAIHQATAGIVNKAGKIVMEDLNAKGMLLNRALSRAVSDVAFREIRRQLEYKCKNAGVELVMADRFFPSSKTCSGCGHKKSDLNLSERTYSCSECGLVIDRDLNAAINLANYSPTSKSEGSKACGARSSLALPESLALKQELKLNCKQIKT